MSQDGIFGYFNIAR